MRTETIDWRACEAITFDCYGTLIDWEAGILGALGPMLSRRGLEVDDESLLERFAHHESALEAGPYLPYRQVLTDVVAALGRDFGFEPEPETELRALADSVPDWPPFVDTVEALRRLAGRYRLGILSNVDDALFDGTARGLGCRFEWVVTAEQVGSYKPSRANFAALLERLDVDAGRHVHAAQSLFHDIGPASELGISTVWVDRRGDRGGGATPGAEAVPDLRVGSLAELAEIACR